MRRSILFGILLILPTVLFYANGLGGEFVFDDVKLVEENPAIRSVSEIPGSILGRVGSYDPVASRDVRIDPGYRPVRFISYALDAAIWGMEPFGFHLTNLLLHILNGLLVFLLGRRLFGTPIPAFAVGLLFLLHPVHTEAVTYISGRRDLLFLFFYLLAAFAYMRGLEAKRPGWFAVAVVAFLLSLFSKEMGITLPVLLLAHRAWLHRPEDAKQPVGLGSALRRNGFFFGVLFGVALLFTGFKLFWKNPAAIAGGATGYWGGSPATALLTLPRVIWHYISLLFFPIRLSSDYSHAAFLPSQGFGTPPETAVALVGLALAAGLALHRLRRGRPLLAWSLGAFLLLLLPVSQLVPHPERVGERFLYLPSLAVLGGLVAGLRSPASRRPVAFGVALGILSIILGLRTTDRNEDYRNPYRFWKAAAEAQPDCGRARLAFGQELLKRAEQETDDRIRSRALYRKAEDHFATVQRLLPRTIWDRDPRFAGIAQNAIFGRAQVLSRLGKNDEAAILLRTLLTEGSLAFEPSYAHIPFNLAAIERERGRTDTALGLYEQVIRLLAPPDPAPALPPFGLFARTLGTIQGLRRPDFLATSHLKRGELLLQKEATEAAIRAFREAVRLLPTGQEAASARYALASALITAGRAKEAIPVLEALTEKDEGFRQARYKLAHAYDLTGRPEDAERELRAIIARWPTFDAAHLSLGALLFGQNEWEKAEREFRIILRRHPGNRKAREFLMACRAARQSGASETGSNGEKAEPTPAEKARLLLRGGLRLLREGKSRDAIPLLKQAVQLDPKGRAQRHHLARALVRAGYPKQAVETYETAIKELGDEGLHLHDDLAILKQQIGDARGALQTLDRYLKRLAPDHSARARMLKLRGDLLTETGDDTGAASAYHRALEESGGEYAGVYLPYVRALIRCVDFKQAKRMGRTYLARFPAGRDAEVIRDLLDGLPNLEEE